MTDSDEELLKEIKRLREKDKEENNSPSWKNLFGDDDSKTGLTGYLNFGVAVLSFIVVIAIWYANVNNNIDDIYDKVDKVEERVVSNEQSISVLKSGIYKRINDIEDRFDKILNKIDADQRLFKASMERNVNSLLADFNDLQKDINSLYKKSNTKDLEQKDIEYRIDSLEEKVQELRAILKRN